MRVATWNVNSLKARLERVEGWLDEVAPDVVCLQETKMADGAFPALAFEARGYEATHFGEGRWNGVAILSRVGLEDPAADFSDGPDVDGEARIVAATCGGVRVHSVYVPNGRSPDHEQYARKLAFLARMRTHLEHESGPAEPVVVCGDFNVAPDDRDVYDPAAFVGETHVTSEERRALADLCDWGLVDVFREKFAEDGLFSWWDYRAGNFHKRKGMRIDLVLATTPLAETVEWVLVDRNARKGKSPSDHAPVVAAFGFDAQSAG